MMQNPDISVAQACKIPVVPKVLADRAPPSWMVITDLKIAGLKIAGL
jgi:hypothetical protein